MRLFPKHVFVFLFSSFQIHASAQDYYTNGNAVKLNNSDCYRLTLAKGVQNGSVWYSDQLDLTKNFKLEFTMNFGNIDANGADGIVFVMQTVGTNALGTSGGGMGFNGFSPAFGIEFDTWQNTDQGDPTYDHVAFVTNGVNDHKSSNNLAGPVQISKSSGNVEDGQDHIVVVEWLAAGQTLLTYFDCELRLSKSVNLVKNIFNGKTQVYWGFTAATGGAWNNQTVCLRKDIIIVDSFNICRGGLVQISAGQAIDNNYSWSPAVNISNSKIQKPVVSPLSSQFYVASYKNYCNLTMRDSIWVEVKDGPYFNLGNDTVLCQGTSIQYNISHPKATKYSWENASSNPVRTLNKGGLYWAKVSDDSGCFFVDTLRIIDLPAPKVSLGNDTAICDNASLTISLDLANNYIWHDGSTANARTFDKAGKYWVRTFNACGEAADTLVVSLLPSPEVNLGIDTALCAGEMLVLPKMDKDVIGYIWQDGSTFSSYSVSKEGLYHVSVLSANKCVAADSIFVKYISPPTVNWPVDTIVCRNEVLRLKVIGREMEVFWNGVKGDSVYSVSNFDGQINMSARNNCGTIDQSIQVGTRNCFCKVYFSNAITINEDLLNEEFGPVYDCIWQDYQLLIYNRWGEKLFETVDPKQKWDGKYNGVYVPNGYYIWTVFYTALENTYPVSFHQKGVVYVLR